MDIELDNLLSYLSRTRAPLNAEPSFISWSAFFRGGVRVFLLLNGLGLGEIQDQTNPLLFLSLAKVFNRLF